LGFLRIHSARIRARCSVLLILRLLLVILICQAVSPVLVFAASANGTSATVSQTGPTGTQPGTAANPSDYVPDLVIDHSGAAAAVIETGRQRLLYNDSANQYRNIPAANMMMTALIACEKLPLDTLVTISSVAEEAAANEKIPDGIALKSGSKFPLEYLLLRLIYYNSDAAALAIAEQVAGDETKFVTLMNTRAAALKLESTLFADCTGRLTIRPLPGGDVTGVNGNKVELTQYSTAQDTARLVAAALQNQSFSRLFHLSSEYLFLEGRFLVPLSNALQQIWTLSEGRITGAFYCEQANRTFMIACGKIKNVDVVIVTAGGQPDSRISDLQKIAAACDDHYVVTPLVQAGAAFAAEQERTVDGEAFGLVYKSTVSYIHPVGDSFLSQTIQYKSYGPFTRPILYSMTVGQVQFTLKDGTVIAADVVPERQLLSRSTVIGHMLEALQNNPNLSVIILAASCLLMIILVVQVILGGRRLIYLVSLLILEKRSRH
jgi:D-alanyl-D-alanine carboxypeptidase